MNNNLEKNNLINYWIESSDNDYKTMIDLFETKNYHWALFIGHLVLEKLFKAKYIQEKNDFPPLIHDLRRIAVQIEIEIDELTKLNLDTITRFNINARYDDYKQSFYKICTEEFTKEWIEKIKGTRIWIKKLLSK